MSESGSIDIFEYGESLVSSDSQGPHIRLIELRPSNDFDANIHMKLHDYALGEDCLEYETLSYVWGDSTERTTVWCNDLALEITTSLDFALRHLRSFTKRLLWIDQICINQGNNMEKTFQVGLMRDIYQKSVRTLAWLGTDNEAISTTFATFDRLSTCWSEKLMSLDDDDDSDASSRGRLDEIVEASRDPEKHFGTHPPTVGETRKINEALCNPWFTRMWVVQEIAVSAELVLVAGSREMSFDSFALGLVVYQSMDAETRRNNRINAGQHNLTNLIKIRGAHQKRHDTVQNRQLALPFLLARCCCFKASDFRDRFYALYGLTSTDLASASLSTNYTSAPIETMSQTVLNILRNDKSLRLLELAECKNDPSLPSWVPGPRSQADPKLLPLSKLLSSDNEGIQDTIQAFANLHLKDLEERYPGFDSDAFNEGAFAKQRALSARAERLGAQPATPLDYIEMEDSNTLCLKGQLLDRIDQVSPVVLLPAAMNRGYGCFDHDNIDLGAQIDKASADMGDSVGEVAKTVARAFGVTAKFVGSVLAEWKVYNNANVTMDAMVMNRNQSAYSSREELIAAYYNTVCAGQWNLASDGERYPAVSNTLVGDLSNDEVASAFAAWRSTIAGGVRLGNLKSKIGFKSGVGWAGLLSTSLSAHATYSMPYKVMMGTGLSYLLGRRMAWTVKGRLALVPAKSEPGDLIFCLGGGDMPFVLRSTGNAFKLLGPTYLDGHMNGELTDVETHGIIRLV